MERNVEAVSIFMIAAVIIHLKQVTNCHNYYFPPENSVLWETNKNCFTLLDATNLSQQAPPSESWGLSQALHQGRLGS